MTGRGKKLFVLVSMIILLMATVVLLAVGKSCGWDILGWFSSKWAMWIYAGIGIAVTVLAYFALDTWRRRF